MLILALACSGSGKFDTSDTTSDAGPAEGRYGFMTTMSADTCDLNADDFETSSPMYASVAVTDAEVALTWEVGGELVFSRSGSRIWIEDETSSREEGDACTVNTRTSREGLITSSSTLYFDSTIDYERPGGCTLASCAFTLRLDGESE